MIRYLPIGVRLVLTTLCVGLGGTASVAAEPPADAALTKKVTDWAQRLEDRIDQQADPKAFAEAMDAAKFADRISQGLSLPP